MQVNTSYKDIWNIAYPMTLGMLAEKAIDLVDTAFMARVGEAELGATGLGGVFYFLTVIIGFGLAMGAQILIARNEGKKSYEVIGRLFDCTIIVCLAIAAIVFVLIHTVSPLLFDIILSSEDVRVANNDYLQYRAFGLFFTMAAFTYRSFFVGIARTHIITVSSFLMAIINIPLNYCFIFGYGIIPEMGIKGAAIASVIAEFSAVLMLFVYTVSKKSFGKYQLYKSFKVEMQDLRSILKLSGPIMLQFMLAMTAWYSFFLIIEKIGEQELAISNVIRSAYMVLMTPVFGFSFAANSMVSNIIGQGRESEVMLLIKKIWTLSLITTVIIVAFSWIFEIEILKLLASESEIVYASVASFEVIFVALLLFSIAMIYFHSVSGTGATKEGMMFEVGCIILYVGYTYFFAIVMKSSVEMVWGAEILYWICIGVSSYFYMRSNHWRKYLDL